MRLLILFFFIPFLGFSQATATARASATVIRIEDTARLEQIDIANLPEDTVMIGDTPRAVEQILGEPLEKIILKNNKQKWIYKDMNIYITNQRVEIIIKKP